MPDYVSEIQAIGVHGRFDLRLHFHPEVNIVFGRNGGGKTTLLHLLANILEGDYERFRHLAFRWVQVGLSDGSVVRVTRTDMTADATIRVTRDGECVKEFPVAQEMELTRRPVPPDVSARVRRRMLEEMELHRSAELQPLLSTAYFPAFRTMIEAWAAVEEPAMRVPPRQWRAGATGKARDWFGEFVPSVSFPSLLEIEDRLAGEIGAARATVSRADRTLLSEAFLNIFQALSRTDREVTEGAETVLAEIGELFERLKGSPLQTESMILTGIDSQLRDLIGQLRPREESESSVVGVLEVYRAMLSEIVDVQEGSFAKTQRYLTSVNEFLEEKDLVIDPEPPRYRGTAVGVRFSDGSYARGLRALSSGERQIVTLIYAATHMSEQQVVLIDEPEISLHVDWQRMLVPKMAEQLGDRQIIACTHSPVIGEDYEDRVLELELSATAEPVVEEREIQEEEDLL